MFVIDIIGGMFLSLIIFFAVGIAITLPLHLRYPALVNFKNVGWLLFISLALTYLIQITDNSKWWGFSESLYEASREGILIWLLTFVGLFIAYTILTGICALGVGMSLTSSLLNNLDPSYESLGMAVVEMYSDAPTPVIVNILIAILMYSCVAVPEARRED